MKSESLIWPCIASLTLHAAAFAAASLLNASAATIPPTPGYVSIAFVEPNNPSSKPEREGEAATDSSSEALAKEEPPRFEHQPHPANEPDGEGEAPADSSSEALAKEEPPRHDKEPSVTAKAPSKEERRPSTKSETSIQQTSQVTPDGSAGALPSPSVSSPSPNSLTPPSILRLVEPKYPRSARREGHEGRVVIEAAVSSTGSVLAVNIVESSGFNDLDQAAAVAAERSRFVPASSAGTPVKSEKRLVFRFLLEELP